MIIPQFWAEGRAQAHHAGRSFTVRRFGWSDASLAEAQANADARAAEALERVLSGENLRRRELKVPYNGADGLPIREEIVARYGDTVITRNSYGARCLNTPNALFADIDYSLVPPYPLACLTFLVLPALAIGAGWLASSWCLGIVLVFVALAVAWPIASLQYQAVQKLKGGAETAARDRIARFLEDHSDWSVRVYRTPAGLRLLATHRPFDPIEPAVSDFFAAIGADVQYVRMCRNQQCFRARVSPKPWRIGIDHHIRPRPGVWPVRPERLPQRQAWIDAYEQAATGFAACEFVEALGSGITHPELASVVRLHDELSRATSGLPIA